MGQSDENAGVTEFKTKLVLVGDCGCGKTTLIKRYVNSAYPENSSANGLYTYNTTYQVTGGNYKIQMSIWDTTGDAEYEIVRPVTYSGADIVLLCFSIGNPDSLYNIVSKWVPEVREHCPNVPIMIVGCGSDMRTDEAVLERLKRQKQTPITYEQGLKTAKEVEALVYSETSAKTSEKSVKDVIEVAALSALGSKQHKGNGKVKRQKSFMKKKRFEGIGEAKTTLRKEAKGCSIM